MVSQSGVARPLGSAGRETGLCSAPAGRPAVPSVKDSLAGRDGAPGQRQKRLLSTVSPRQHKHCQQLSVVSALRSLKQEDYTFWVILGYIVSSKSA